jgi:hypothetical protein
LDANFLRGVGFQFYTFNGFSRRVFKPLILNNDVNPGLRQMLWSDAIYVKDWMNLSDLDVNKLQKYALLSNGALALLCR